MMRRVDLLPSIYEERRRERRNFYLILAAGGAVLVLLILWYLALGLQVNNARDELAQKQAENTRLVQEILELQRFADLESQVQNKKTALQTVMVGDLDWPAIMTEIAMVIPDDVWLTSLTTSAGTTEGASQVPTETNAIDIDPREPFGRILFEGRALSMRSVANWLIRTSTVDEFLAVYLGGAERGEGGEETGGISIVDWSSTLELGEKAVSGRFQEGDLGEED